MNSSGTIELERLNTIYKEMTEVYGFSDPVRAKYAHITNLMVAQYYDEGFEVFINLYRTSSIQNPVLNLRILQFYSQAMLHRKDYTKLEKKLDGIVQDFEDANLYNNYAIALVHNGKTKEAVEYLRKAVEMNPLEQIQRNLDKVTALLEKS